MESFRAARQSNRDTAALARVVRRLAAFSPVDVGGALPRVCEAAGGGVGRRGTPGRVVGKKSPDLQDQGG